MSRIVQNLALGAIALNTHRTERAVAAVNTHVQALLDLEQSRLNAEDEQQYLRNALFTARSFLEQQLAELSAEEGLYWLAWLRNKFTLEKITPQRFCSLADKEAALQLMLTLDRKLSDAIDCLGREPAEALIDAARLAYAIPVLDRLSALAELRTTLQTARQVKAFRRKLVAVAAVLSIVPSFFVVKSHYFQEFVGAALGSMILFFLPAKFVVLRVAAWAIKPARWATSVELGRRCGLTLEVSATKEDIDRNIGDAEQALAAVSELPSDDSTRYISRAHDAGAEFEATCTRHGIVPQ